jgi:hypothetical protein
MSSGKYKTKNRINYSIAKYFEEFKEQNPTTNITAKQYVEILKESNKLIGQAILENPHGFKLPNNIGYIAIDKYKIRNKIPIDWVTSRKLGKKTYLTNLHSFGFIYRIRFYKNPNKAHLCYYVFKAQRLLKRSLAQKIFGGKEYEHLDRTFFSRRFSIDKIFKTK